MEPRRCGLSPRDPQAAFAEGNALAGLGLFRQAAGAFEKAVALAPQTVSYRVNLGNSLLLSGHARTSRGAIPRGIADSSWGRIN